MDRHGFSSLTNAVRAVVFGRLPPLTVPTREETEQAEQRAKELDRRIMRGEAVEDEDEDEEEDDELEDEDEDEEEDDEPEDPPTRPAPKVQQAAKPIPVPARPVVLCTTAWCRAPFKGKSMVCANCGAMRPQDP